MMEKETQQKRRVGDGTPGPGRKKGVPNKTTTQLKEAILEAAAAAGGEGQLVGYLTLQAQENPAAFMTLLGKVLPLTIAGDATNPLRAITKIELVAAPVASSD